MSKIESFSKAFALGLPAVAAVAFAGLLLAPEAQAQTATAYTGPGANSATTPSVLPLVGSTTVVSIAAPTLSSSGANVSHNVYSSFNVNSGGLVLNNCSTTASCATNGTLSALTNTALGANGNLTGAAATLILNEVTGGSLSKLLGKIETFGQAADFILANPAGVTCDGCGFINTPRVTLTTGVPNADGSQYTVTGGSVIIGAGGADLNGLNYFDIIAQSVSAQGQGFIKDFSASSSQTNVRMLSGNNTYTYDYAHPDNFNSTSQGGTPGGGIDLSALGGANAGQITLISTDKGVGINTPPTMNAAYGGINLTANGKIVFNNATAQGPINATSNGTSASNGIAVNGSQVSAQGAQGSVNFVTTTSGDIQLLGGVAATSTLTLKAAGAVTVGSGITVSSSDAIDINAQAGDLTNGGIISGKTLKLAAAATLSNKLNSKLTADTSINIASAQMLANDGEISTTGAAGTIAATVTNFTNTGSFNAANGAVSATVSGNFNNTGTIGIDPSTNATSAASADLTAGSFSNSGKVASNGTTSVTTTLGDLTNSGSISGQSLNANAAGTLANKAGGHLTSTDGMTLSAKALSNADTIGAGTTLGVTATAGDLTNTGQITAQGSTTIKVQAGSLTNSGTLSSQADLTANASGDLTNTGTISGQTLSLGASGTLANQAGGQLTSTDGMTLSANNLTNADNIHAGTTLGVTTGGDLTNIGQIAANQDANIKVGGTLTNGASPTPVNATINAGGTLSIQASVLKNLGGIDITLPRGELSGLYLIINAGNVQNSGNLFATKDMTIDTAGDLVNEMGWIKAGGYLSITVGGNFDNIVGMIQASSWTVNAQSMENVVLVRLDDDQLLPKKNHNLLRAITSQSVAQAVAGWDKSVLAKFGTVDNKALDTLRLQLGDPFLMQQKQQQQGKGAGNFPQPGQGASAKRADAAAGARPTAF